MTVDRPTPEAESKGTTDEFYVTTHFRGDEIAAMESTYASGGNAGLIDWNPYQEFNKAFRPDYANSKITLMPDYLKALRDGEKVNLTFHFYSGATVKYQVTRDGSKVTGSTV
ncbi:hypothetical protein AB0D13_08665 [Streptomyces sp. NPDC048430]|uniref:hypothetical protein n=1 Tax=unclassified Streptomyces TaxID=2593676 RepID=UPI00341F9979